MKMIFLLLSLSLFVGCSDQSSSLYSQPSKQKAETTLVIYSGITMVQPLQKLANEFAQKHNISIQIKQGASGYLYQTLKDEQRGDIYFPGTDHYRIKYQHEGFLKDYRLVGYNRIAIIVAKDNPKQLTNNLNQLLDPNLSVVLSAPSSGAVGKATQKLLQKLNIERQVYDNVTYFTTDSHRLMYAIKNQEADITLNWQAVANWPQNLSYLTAIPIEPAYQDKKRLELNLLSFSKQPEIAQQFMEFASSENGLRTFMEYGFLTSEEVNELINNKNAHKISKSTQQN